MELSELQLNKNHYKITENPVASLSSEVQSENIESGEISGNLTINKGFLQSKNYINGTSGYRLSDTGIIYCTGLEVANGVITGATITGGTVTGTTLIGGTLNVPDATTPLFSVDSSGNVVCSSLRRRDFHFVTYFESVDGYDLDKGAGAGLGLESVNLKTVATADDFVSLTKQNVSVAFKGLTWNKKFSIKMCIKLGSDFDGGTQTMNFGRGGFSVDDLHDSGTGRKVGFNITDGVLYGVCGDGSASSNVNLMSISTLTGSSQIFEMDYTPAVGCNFYVNDVLKGSVTTNLPSGTISSGYIMTILLKTLENAAKTVDIVYYDLWQQL